MRLVKLFIPVIILTFLYLGCGDSNVASKNDQATTDDGSWFVLTKEDVSNGEHHINHLKTFGKYVAGYNFEILRAIDTVQAHAMNGGGYFIGKDSIPTESPVGYDLHLFGKSLITPPRTTSYCSGSSYAAFIEALNFILKNKADSLSADRLEAMRMQEPDGGRRNDWIKYWGIWNADGFGSEYALEQYSGMGKSIKPNQARPGDFVNISWKSGNGHSVIFLGWYKNDEGKKNMVYWSSQTGTNGYGDQIVSLDRIKNVKFVRLTNPENLFIFNINQAVNKDVPGDMINW